MSLQRMGSCSNPYNLKKKEPNKERKQSLLIIFQACQVFRGHGVSKVNLLL
uniref:Uncharacterized protein n=1 Tax=Anguilla anguilla TaxID=7936 RepID=A0A0E9VH03_ANGAN